MIKEKLNKRIIETMKNKEVTAKGTLQLLKAAIGDEEIAKKRELKEDEIIALVKRQIKQTSSLRSDAVKAGREDLLEELDIAIRELEVYLPAQLTKDEIREVMVSKGANSDMKLGQLIGLVMATHKSEVNAVDVKEVAQDFING